MTGMLVERLIKREYSTEHGTGSFCGTREKLLGEWAGRLVPNPDHLTILDQFHREVSKNPDRVAVRHAGKVLTYRDLDSKAGALAAKMSERGVCRSSVVPVIINNSLELPIAWWSVMKLGAAFVPVDPDWPTQRIQKVIDVISPPITLVTAESGYLELSTASLIVDASELSETVHPPMAVVASSDLIYGFFTSGSTGTPKCALNIHRGIFNRFWFMSKHFGHLGRKVTLQNSKFVFDSSVWQLLWPLTEGGEVVIPEVSGHLDLLRTIDLIEQFGVTMTDFVPSVFNTLTMLLCRSPALTHKLRTLRQLLIGGEAINPKFVSQFRKLMPHVGITNTYGPTEASIGMVFHDIEESDCEQIPLGTPIDNTYLVILDERRRLVEAGTVGEIYIGGVCLGAGYFNDLEKTQAAFVDNPFQEIPGERIYRTGDLGCHRADGKVLFCGRVDGQVKIGGARIELGEIDQELQRYPSVLEAATLSIKRPNGSNMLVAFVTHEGSFQKQELQAHLSQTLPTFMVPHDYVCVPQMPLTANGKLDRRALVRIYAAATSAGRDRIVANADEQKLLHLIGDVLGRENITLDTDFFDAGGDSLQAIGLVIRIEETFGQALDISTIYEFPTVRGLVQQLGGFAVGKNGGAGWKKDATLAASINFVNPTAPIDIRTVFLTGATGFVGAHILAALLEQTHSRVLCGVRAETRGAAQTRLMEALKSYDLWRGDFTERIDVIVVDLGMPGLSLDANALHRLENEVDAIVHAGGMVDLLHDYRHHRRVNVSGTAELLRIAAMGRSKYFHHISTLAIFKPKLAAQIGLIREEPNPAAILMSEDGYGQSKCVAEMLVNEARSRGLLGAIYRIGEVGPSTRTGAANAHSLFHFLLKACALTRSYPTTPIYIGHTSADAVGTLVSQSVTSTAGIGKTLHVFDDKGQPFSHICEGLNRHGMGLSRISDREFVTKLSRAAITGDHELHLFLLLLQRIIKQGRDVAALFSDPRQMFTHESFDELLHCTGLTLPTMTESGLERMAVRYCRIRETNSPAQGEAGGDIRGHDLGFHADELAQCSHPE